MSYLTWCWRRFFFSPVRLLPGFEGKLLWPPLHRQAESSECSCRSSGAGSTWGDSHLQNGKHVWVSCRVCTTLCKRNCIKANLTFNNNLKINVCSFLSENNLIDMGDMVKKKKVVCDYCDRRICDVIHDWWDWSILHQNFHFHLIINYYKSWLCEHLCVE